MSRQFKFKVWDTATKSWLSSFNFPLDEGVVSLIGFTTVPVYPNRYIYCQNTGFKDKNGKEIYEGDILRVADEEVVGSRHYPYAHVWFVEGGGTWIASYNHEYSEVSDNLSHIYFKAEVKGTIMESPELLKKYD